MPPVRIVTDSTADLPDELYQRFGIHRVPLKVLFGQEIFLDGIDITIDEFYNRLRRGDMATTSQPAPGEFARTFEELSSDSSQVICLTLSSMLSGTFQSAVLARNMVKGEIEVIDTQSASWGVGFMAMAAARAAAEGKSKNEIINLVLALRSKIRILFLVDSLEHLERGGRIGKAQAFLGSLLNIKPVLSVKEGIVFPHEKVRGKNKGLERIVQIALQDTNGAEAVCAVVGGADPEARKSLYEKVKTRLNCREIWQGDVGPVIGCHAGPGVSGIVYYTL